MHQIGADIVLSKLPIGDLATQWFADRGIFCAGRVPDQDIKRVSKATGAVLQTTVNKLTPEVLGTTGTFNEKQIGAERYNLFEDCPSVFIALLRPNQPLLFWEEVQNNLLKKLKDLLTMRSWSLEDVSRLTTLLLVEERLKFSLVVIWNRTQLKFKEKNSL